MPLPRLLLATAFATFSFSAFAADSYELVLKDHAFSPNELTVPAGKEVKITVKNTDATSAEFESEDLNVEKVINATSEAVVTVGPLKPGVYNFEDEFHDETAQGKITAK